MKYMGSKSRISKSIVPIIQKHIDDNSISNYYEPFCGGCNIIDKIKCQNRYASDSNEYLIELLKNKEKLNSLPNTISRELYNEVKNDYKSQKGKFSKWYIGAIGFLSSYNAKFFGGYAGETLTKNGIRNYYLESKKNLMKQDLHNIHFETKDYRDVCYKKNSLIYCDIPYINKTSYKNNQFDHTYFYNWVTEMTQKGYIIFISEENMPKDFNCIWEQSVLRSLDNNKRVTATEKLFVV